MRQRRAQKIELQAPRRGQVEVEIEMPEPTGIVPENIPLRIIDEDADIPRDRQARRNGRSSRGGISRRARSSMRSSIITPKSRALATRNGRESFIGWTRRLRGSWSSPGTRVPISSSSGSSRPARSKKFIWRSSGANPPGTREASTGRSAVTPARRADVDQDEKTADGDHGIPGPRRNIEDHSLLEVRPLTGRTHQISVHMAAAGHPVAGDSRYGSRAEVGSPVSPALSPRPPPLVPPPGHGIDQTFHLSASGRAPGRIGFAAARRALAFRLSRAAPAIPRAACPVLLLRMEGPLLYDIVYYFSGNA